MSLGDVINAIVAVAALVVALTALFLSTRPATLTLTVLPERTKVIGGGMNGFPSCSELRVTAALSNVGAGAGLLERIDVESPPSVNPEARGFATAVVTADQAWTGRAQVELDDTPFADPRTIEAGDVRTLTLNMGLAGEVRDARNTQALPGYGPDPEAIARLIRDVEFVSIRFAATYRRGRGLVKQRTAKATVRIDGGDFKRTAAAYWEADRAELKAIVDEGVSQGAHDER